METAASAPIAAILSALTLGQVSLAAGLLGLRPPHPVLRVPLGLVLVTLAVVVAGPALALFGADIVTRWMAGLLVALYALPVVIWLYVKALTAPRAGGLTRADGRHAALLAPALIAALLVLGLPAETRRDFLLGGHLAADAGLAWLALFLFALVIGWMFVSAAYLGACVRRLLRFRRRLHDLLANTEQREMAWLLVFLIGLSLVWLIAVSLLIADNLLSISLPGPALGAAIGLAFTSLIALIGLNQAPGLAGHFDEAADWPAEASAPKYARSALDAEQARRIAERLAQRMAHDQLYADPNLSLPRLASALGVPANRLSQTLNQVLGESFFDHVNRWRIEAAAPLLRATDRSVLEIALEVGFNARSTFYTAFRKVMGCTPRAYRARPDTAS